jgi:hypothetical protein
MTQPNLFIRLEGYGRENFTTEALAHILESDISLRRAFIGLLLKEKKPHLLKKFKDYSISTQTIHDVGRPDMELVSCSDHRTKVFVEVKTGAPEGDGQIGRYLKRAPTAFLSPHDYILPTHYDQHRSFLGHFFWQDVFALIAQRKSDNIVQQQFLKYMESRHMAPIKPITREELDSAAKAVEFLNKSRSIVDSVRKRIKDEWAVYGENVGAQRVAEDFDQEGFHCWWYRPKTWKKNERRFHLSIGIGLDKKRKRPAFYVCVGSGHNGFWNDKVEPELEKQIKKLVQWGWVRSKPTDRESGYYKFFPLKTGKRSEAMFDELVKNVHEAMKDLQTLQMLRKIQKLL